MKLKPQANNKSNKRWNLHDSPLPHKYEKPISKIQTAPCNKYRKEIIIAENNERCAIIFCLLESTLQGFFHLFICNIRLARIVYVSTPLAHRAYPLRGCRVQGIRILLVQMGLLAKFPLTVYEREQTQSSCKHVRMMNHQNLRRTIKISHKQ